MSIIIAALAVVGGVVYILFVLLSYSSESSRLGQELQVLQVRLAAQKQRIQEYEHRLKSLTEEEPLQRGRCDRLSRWIDLLKGQKVQVESEQKRPRRAEGRSEREEVVRQFLTGRKGQKG
ncbi:MAG: hypothetical protein O2954_04675 [bacterium]|nr:hypothetical protein [bacterium]